MPLPGIITGIGSAIEDVGTGGLAVTGNPKGTAALESGAGAVESAATAVPDFLSRLTSASLWLRVAEVGLGILLIIVGLEKISNLNVTGKVASAAKVAAL